MHRGPDEFMKLALVQAEEALDAGEVPIGCIFVSQDGCVLGAGRNRTNESHNATRHAEIVAVDQVLDRSPQVDWSQMTLYVTVEPCIMCAAALRLLGVRQVYFGCRNDRFGGCGSIIPAHKDFMGSQVAPLQCHELAEDWRRPCVTLLRRFYLRENERAPKPRRKKNRILKEGDLY